MNNTYKKARQLYNIIAEVAPLCVIICGWLIIFKEIRTPNIIFVDFFASVIIFVDKILNLLVSENKKREVLFCAIWGLAVLIWIIGLVKMWNFYFY